VKVNIGMQPLCNSCVQPAMHERIDVLGAVALIRLH
jgi:hypothetical protein